jgi:hypothetical protein
MLQAAAAWNGLADLISELLNNSVTAAIQGLRAGLISGVGSGVLNANTGFSGLFNIQKALAG